MIRGRGVEKRYGRTSVLPDLDIVVPPGGFAVVTGSRTSSSSGGCTG